MDKKTKNKTKTREKEEKTKSEGKSREAKVFFFVSFPQLLLPNLKKKERKKNVLEKNESSFVTYIPFSTLPSSLSLSSFFFFFFYSRCWGGLAALSRSLLRRSSSRTSITQGESLNPGTADLGHISYLFFKLQSAPLSIR